MQKILVTGGCGYIGGHTIVDLIQNGYEVISVDNLSHGSLRMLSGVEKIVGRPVKNYKVDLCNLEDTEAIFIENPDITGIIHFAAYKSVPESVEKPLMYFRNNINSLVNKGLYSGGFGIDVVTFYDFVFRAEFSMNQLGEKGVFFHIRNDF